jgi:signal transduction histidine kinase
LEEENDHLLASVGADRRSEEMLRWGLPLLLLLGIAVTVVVVRLQRRSRTLDEAERMSDAKNQFIASVSHELRTPLTPIVAFGHELKDRIGDFSHEEVVEFVETIATSSDAVAAIVDDLLTAARIDAGRLAVNSEVVDLQPLLDQALTSMDRKVEVRVDVTGAVCADRGRLIQIIRNLAANARRYGRGIIEITNRPMGDNVLVVVADSGSGIPFELSNEIFEPFSSAHQVDGRPASVGLGLTVSRRLASLMGGDLTYTREAGWSTIEPHFARHPTTGPFRTDSNSEDVAWHVDEHAAGRPSYSRQDDPPGRRHRCRQSSAANVTDRLHW